MAAAKPFLSYFSFIHIQVLCHSKSQETQVPLTHITTCMCAITYIAVQNAHKYQTTALQLVLAQCGPSGATKSSFSDVKQALYEGRSCSPSCLLSDANHMSMLLNGKRSLPPRPSGSLSINNKRRQTLSAGRRRYTQPDEWPPESHFTNKKGALLCWFSSLDGASTNSAAPALSRSIWSQCSIRRGRAGRQFVLVDTRCKAATSGNDVTLQKAI